MSDFGNLFTSAKSAVIVAMPPNGRKLTGELEYTPEDGISVNLLDASFDFESLVKGATAQSPMILGQLRSGPMFTLLDCLPAQTQFGGAGLAQIRVVANAMLLGVHLNTPDAAAFDEVRVTLTGLNEWFGDTPITSEMVPLLAPEAGHKITVVCKHVPVFSLPSIRGSTLTSDQEIGTHDRELGKAGVYSRFTIRIITAGPASIENCTDELLRVQSFFALLYGFQPFIESVQLFPHGKTGAERHRLSCRLFASFARPREKKRQEVEPLLPRPLIREALPTLWERWTERYPLYQTAIQIYTSTEMFHGQMLNFELLAIMQALETLHRNRFEGKYVPDDNYSVIAAALGNAIPPDTAADLKSSLRARIRYGNEYSLRKRLKELSRQLPTGVGAILNPDLVPFLERAVDTRNYLTHFDPVSKEAAFSGEKLFWATRLLRWFFLAVLLNDMGLPSEILDAALRRAQELHHARQVLTDTPIEPPIKFVKTEPTPPTADPVGGSA